MTHELKVWSQFFEAIESGIKTFEVRYDDRGYKVGDILELKSYDYPSATYDGRMVTREVSYILRGPAWGIEERVVVMAIRPVPSAIGRPDPLPPSSRGNTIISWNPFRIFKS